MIERDVQIPMRDGLYIRADIFRPDGGPKSRGMMDGSAKILSFSSPPLDEDLEVTGPILFRADLSSTASVTDIIVKIFEVPPGPPAGPLMAVTRGWSKASHRALDTTKSQPQRPFHSHDRVDSIKPGQIYEVDVETWPT